MKTCPRCHHQVKKDALFCDNCGYKFSSQPNNGKATNPQSAPAGNAPVMTTQPPAKKHHVAGWIAAAVAVIIVLCGAVWYFHSPASVNMESELQHNKWDVTIDGHKTDDMTFHNTYITHKGKVDHTTYVKPLSRHMIQMGGSNAENNGEGGYLNLKMTKISGKTRYFEPTVFKEAKTKAIFKHDKPYAIINDGRYSKIHGHNVKFDGKTIPIPSTVYNDLSDMRNFKFTKAK